ncbi:DUF1810 domain-containing protein [Rhizobacter sp. Root404]|jgi:uncharacterized protein (DUF1810 family)|uniref:DUF1810 domain-containing protein n=1 Tax=Rhizobacter sp. Root404 TaxID=1736528 RepID=UPI0006F54F48|nr:DUF1810 domain-containing protein [Rhizobacter sp. Root404]KQW35601.1 calpastatin [Rhizobacter sp. Root404]
MSAEGVERFLDAQEPIYGQVVEELRRGRKTGHWMWFVFPQLRGLGRSPTAQFYGLASADEARAYLAQPVLGQRLRQCVDLVLAVDGRSVHDIFGSPDDLKLRSSLTLFDHVAPHDPVFGRALDRLFGGVRDDRTLALLGHRPSTPGDPP